MAGSGNGKTGKAGAASEDKNGGQAAISVRKETLAKLRTFGTEGESDEEILLRMMGKLEYIQYMEKKVVDMRVKAINHRRNHGNP